MGRRTAIAALLALHSAAAAAAPAMRLTAENDNFNFWQPPDARPDVGYTHGTELEARLGSPGVLRRIPGALLGQPDASRPRVLSLRVRQLIYTPWFTGAADEPFAGWLEAALVASSSSEAGARSLAFHLGVTGPLSAADRVQHWVHRQFGFGPAPDWQGELPAEPGFGFEWSGTSIGAARGRTDRLRVLAGPEWRARLATDAIDGRLGIDAAAGWAPPGPSRAAAGPVSLYVLGALRMDAIARSEFLDGTLFHRSQRARTERLVPEAESGIGLRVAHVRAEWRIHRREPEFMGQPEPHTYSTLSIEWD